MHASQTESNQARRHSLRATFRESQPQGDRGQSPKQSPAFTEFTSRLERSALSQQRAA